MFMVTEQFTLYLLLKMVYQGNLLVEYDL